MSDFNKQIRDAKCNEVHRVVKCDGEKYLCYTRLSESWYVVVTDGVTMWRCELDLDQVEAIQEASNVLSVEAFLTKFRNGFNGGELNVSALGNKVTLAVGKGSSVLNIDLYEAKAADKKMEMKTVLFRLAEVATSLDTELQSSKQMIESLKATKGGASVPAFMDLGPKKGAASKPKPNKAGMSMLNPTSKKRKAAQGVVFD